jgi:fatty-acyl-CoA synthase
VNYPAYDWIARHAARQPGKAACIDVHSHRTLSYAAMDQRARQLAAWLTKDCGLARGDRVAVLSQNTAEHLVVHNACVKAGAINVPLNWRLTARELRDQLANAAPRVLIHEDCYAETARAAAPDASLRLVDWGADGTGGEYGTSVAAAPADFAPVAATLADACAILYTSGATGQPKGVVITHAMLFFNVVNYGMIVRVGQSSVQLCSLPLFHTGGLSQGSSPALHAGGTVVVSRRSDPDYVLDLLDDPALGITHMMGVPASYQMLSQHPRFDSVDLSRIVAAAVGGSPVPLALHHRWRARGVAFQEGYGMTESGPSVYISALDQPLEKVGSCGKPVVHAESRLVTPDGRDANTGEVGEVWVRGPSVTPGYWNNPAATALAFSDGWLKSGDAARRDADGYYYIVDRWKDMYISGGENVYPAEVENVLYELPEVAEVAVIGVADERWGEVGCAAIVLRPAVTLGADQVLLHCDGRLARYKIPRHVVFMDGLPHNEVGKIVKGELRQRLGAGALVRK